LYPVNLNKVEKKLNLQIMIFFVNNFMRMAVLCDKLENRFYSNQDSSLRRASEKVRAPDGIVPKSCQEGVIQIPVSSRLRSSRILTANDADGSFNRALVAQTFTGSLVPAPESAGGTPCVTHRIR
jgi:hypothetical protein